MIYNVNDYFKKYIMYLSDENGANIQEKNISTYLKALSNCHLLKGTIYYSNQKIYFALTLPDENDLDKTYIDTVDNSLNCIKRLHETFYKIKLVNDKLYYSIHYFSNYNRKELNGIYFFEFDQNGNKAFKFYDSIVASEFSYNCLENNNLFQANDSMLQIHGFLPDYEERLEYKGMTEFDAARAFNDLLFTLNFNKTISLMSSCNKKSNDKQTLKLGKKM